MPAHSISTRCFYFFDDGLPRPQKNGSFGCPHGLHCKFTHPGDEGWHTAKSSTPKNSHGPSKYRKNGRSGWGSDQEDNGRDSSFHSRQRRSPSPSALSLTSRGPDPSPIQQLPPPPPSLSPAVETMKPTPIEPLIPPPPLPAPPEFLKRPLKEATASEKEDVWKERFRLMSDGYEHYKDLLALEHDIKVLQMTLGNPYPFLSDEAKQEYKQDLVSLEAECTAKRALRDAALNKLNQTNFWPILSRTETEEVQKKKYEEMVDAVSDLHTTVASIHGVLQTAVTEHNWRVVAEDKGDEGTQRSRKRRRLSYDGEAALSDDDISPTELSTVVDRIQQVEGRLSDLKNILSQRDNDIMEEVIHLIDARYEEDGEPRGADGDSEALEAVEQVKQLVESTGDQMGELAVEVGAVITQVEERSQETVQLKEKYARTLGEIAIEKARLEKQQDENAKIIESLQAGIADLNNRPPPTIPRQHLIDTVEEPIKEIIRSKITPLIDDFQREMDGILHARNEDYQSLWTKVGVTQKMVTAIAQQVSREQASLVSPTIASTSATSS